MQSGLAGQAGQDMQKTLKALCIGLVPKNFFKQRSRLGCIQDSIFDVLPCDMQCRVQRGYPDRAYAKVLVQ